MNNTSKNISILIFFFIYCQTVEQVVFNVRRVVQGKKVTGHFTPRCFLPGPFPLGRFASIFHPSPPCPSHFAPTPFPALVVLPPMIEKGKVFIIRSPFLLRKSFYKYTSDMALYNLRQKCI